jgi:hypothetical protein
MGGNPDDNPLPPITEGGEPIPQTANIPFNTPPKLSWDEITATPSTTQDKYDNTGIVTSILEQNVCLTEWNLYKYKDTILIKIYADGDRVDIQPSYTTNREYHIHEGAPFASYQTRNTLSPFEETYVKKLHLNQKQPMRSATFIKPKTKHSQPS